MSVYPDGIVSFREKQNLPGLEYVPTDVRTIFAEDFTNIESEVIAIEETLGEEVQGTYPTLAERLNDLSPGGGSTPPRCAIYRYTDNQELSAGFNKVNQITTQEYDDTDGLFNSSTSVFTADKAGIWRVGARFDVNNGPRYVLTIYKNGSDYKRLSDFASTPITSPIGNALCVVDEGDELEIYLYCSANGQLITDGYIDFEEVK